MLKMTNRGVSVAKRLKASSREFSVLSAGVIGVSRDVP